MDIMTNKKTRQHNRIFIFDDDQSILQSLSKGLKTDGFNVTTAQTSEDAMKQCRDNYYDLALIDFALNTENTTGLEFVKTLHEIKYLPFIMLTSSEDHDVIMDSARLGAIGYIVKPISIKSLIPQIKVGVVRAQHIYQLQIDTKTTRAIDRAVGIIACRLSVSLDEALIILNNKSRKARLTKLKVAKIVIDEQDEIATHCSFAKLFQD